VYLCHKFAVFDDKALVPFFPAQHLQRDLLERGRFHQTLTGQHQATIRREKTGAGGETRTHTTFLACSSVKIIRKANIYDTLDTHRRYALPLCNMSSIHKQPGRPNWFCAFYDPEGFRRFRSTGTENAKIARTICVNIERAATLTRQGKLSNEKALKLVRETCAAIAETHGKLAADHAESVLKPAVEEFIRIAGGEFTSYTVRSWLDSWLAGRTDASKATLVEYRHVIDLFLKYLGARSDRPLTTLQPKQIEEFKQYLAERVGPSTVNKAVKVLKASFNNAVAKRQLEFSPAEHVENIEVEDANRRPFTDKELKSLLKAAGAEWRTMILTAFYTGLRLRDCANLTWRNVELHTGIINIKTEKTGRQQDLPIAEPLARHLSALAGDKPDAALCPSLAGKPASRLSAQFYKVMVKAGIVEKRNYDGTGKGRDARRETGSVSFHSLRHNCTSALKSSGASDSVATGVFPVQTTNGVLVNPKIIGNVVSGGTLTINHKT
jgi:integrase